MRARDGKDNCSFLFVHSDHNVTVADVDLWLGCHGYLLAITSFASHMAPILQWSIDKLTAGNIFPEQTRNLIQ